jgi:hypothetical protein
MERTKVEELKRRLLPPELNRSRPREVRITGAGAMVRGLGIFLIFVAPLAGLWWGEQLASINRSQDELVSRGQTINAEVVRLWKTSGEKNQAWMAYRFDAGGLSREVKIKTPARIWRGLHVGSPIAVRYLPENPGISHPAEWQASRFPAWIAWTIGILICALGGFMQWRVAAQRGLLENGRAAPGAITKISGSRDHRIAHYEFALLNGSVKNGRCRGRRNVGPVGGNVCVVYDPENLKRSCTYPMRFWRLANNTKL